MTRRSISRGEARTAPRIHAVLFTPEGGWSCLMSSRDRRGRARRARGRLEPSRQDFGRRSRSSSSSSRARVRTTSGSGAERFARCARLVAGDGVRVASRALDVSLALARLGGNDLVAVDASGGSRTRRRASRVASDPRRFLRADDRAGISSRARSPARVTAFSSDASSAPGDEDLGVRVRGPESAAAAKTFRFEGTRRLYGDARFDTRLRPRHRPRHGRRRKLGGRGARAKRRRALTLVDLDFVCVTNVNRQVLASGLHSRRTEGGRHGRSRRGHQPRVRRARRERFRRRAKRGGHPGSHRRLGLGRPARTSTTRFRAGRPSTPSAIKQPWWRVACITACPSSSRAARGALTR